MDKLGKVQWTVCDGVELVVFEGLSANLSNSNAVGGYEEEKH